MTTITYNAINTMLQQTNGKDEHFIVEVSNLKPKSQFIKVDVTDAMTTIKGVIHVHKPQLDLSKIGKPFGQNPVKYLIEINEFVAHPKNNTYVLQILNFVPLNPPKTKSDLGSETKSISKEIQNIKIQEKQQNKTVKKENSIRKTIEPMQYNPTSFKQEENEFDELDSDELRKFQKIGDLYVDFQGQWEIVVRVIQKSYREFNSKMGKLTKIFSMTLIDRTGTKIDGVMFGDNAKDYHDLIVLNGVYRISRGQIRQQNFNQNRGDKYSRYNIVLSRSSNFIRVKEIISIPYGGDSSSNLEEIIIQNNVGQQYDLYAILLQIGEEKVFTKDDGRVINKRTIIVGDPQTLKSIEVTIWNKELKISEEWLSRTVFMKSFKLHNYKDNLSLSSTFKSEINITSKHRFCNLQKTIKGEQFQCLTGGKEEKNNQLKDKPIKTINEIELQLPYISTGQTIYSDLQVWLTNITFKGKWYYDACNNQKCKKGAQSHVKCLHCGMYNDIAHRRFMLPIQLSDSTGSFYTTAFNDFAVDLFKGITIDDLCKLTENELREEVEKRLYQQFKLRLSSRKQIEGNVKHNITGKAAQMNIQKAAISNVERIKRALFL